jgi:sigma-E factor negative regulatory protein RseB
VLCLIAHPVLAADPAADGTASHPELALLQKIQAAAGELDYSGVFISQQGGSMQSSRIVHIVDGTGERERIEALDGEPREFLRHNDAVQCLIPQKKLVVMERRHGDRFPSFLLGDGTNIPDHYLIHKAQRPGRVAGRECTMITLVPRDSQRYGYTICSDVETNLLLRTQIIDANEQVIDQVSFTTLQVGKHADAAQLPSAIDTKGWRVIETPMKDIDLQQQGWRIPFPQGFQTVTQVSRSLQHGRKVSQLVVSDGLAAISAFIEPFDAGQGKTAASVSMASGSLSIFRTRIGDHWLTLIGEVPAEALRDIGLQTHYVPVKVH